MSNENNKPQRDLASQMMGQLRRPADAAPPASILNRATAEPPPPPPPASVAEPEAELTVASAAAASTPKTRRGPRAASERIDQSFSVGQVKGVQTLTVRIPVELHAKLYLLATKNKIARDGSPDNMNEIVTDAIERLFQEAA